VLAALPVAPVQDSGPSAVAQRTSDAVAGARALANELLAAGAPGLSAAVWADGELAWVEGFGFADVERGIAVVPETRFRVGSVAKVYTAAALALLVQEGELDLDAPIQTYVPRFPVKEEGEVTTRLLAGHLAGIRHYKGFEFMANKRFDDVADGLRMFQDDPLVAPPGTKFSYSTYAWSLIAAAIESASGDEFLSHVNERVFRPLGMHCTVADRADVVVPGRTTYYRELGGKRALCPPVDLSYKWAGGGFLSTATDMVRFGAAHLRPGFLEGQTLELLFTSQRTSAGEATGCGIGWFRRERPDGGVLHYHTGGSMGGTTALVLSRESGVVAALTTNKSDGPVTLGHAIRLLELFEPE